MDDELKKMLVSLIEGQQALRIDISKIGAKIDGEISEKLKLLSDEQSMIRREVAEINQGRLVDRQIIQDIKLSVDALHSSQRKQESKIIELDRKLAK